MRMPNGYGGISKLSGNRRNPYCARVTDGWKLVDGKAVQKYKVVGYFATRKEALAALADYNKNPYSLDNDMTWLELYETWSAEYLENIAPSSTRTVKSAFSYTKQIQNMKVRDIRVSHLEGCMKAAPSTNTAERMKSLYNLMYRYALKHELVEKDYAALCYSPKRAEPKIKRILFTDDEIVALRQTDVTYADTVLVGIYTGLRPSELCDIEVKNVHLEEDYLIGGMKTDAGRNRIVPIHRSIYSLIEARYNEALAIGSLYLFPTPNGQYMSYSSYRNRFATVCKALGTTHTMHDTRHTFITRAKDAGMNEYLLKRIVGHAVSDVTEKVYTHRTIQELVDAVNMLPTIK